MSPDDLPRNARRWHCAHCHRLRPVAGVYLWQGTDARGASHQEPCPKCGELEVYGRGWVQRQDQREANDDQPTVCPEHLRFVPCRRCEPGREKFSTDPSDVEQTRRAQASQQQLARRDMCEHAQPRYRTTADQEQRLRHPDPRFGERHSPGGLTHDRAAGSRSDQTGDPELGSSPGVSPRGDGPAPSGVADALEGARRALEGQT